MKQAWLSLTCAASVLAAIPSAAQGDSVDSIYADIAAVKEEIKALESDRRYEDGSLLWTLAETERSILQLALAALESRRLTFEGKAVEVVAIPVTQPDREAATEILADIAAQTDIVKEAEIEAEAAGGLVGALAQTRAITEKIVLARLKMGYFQSVYGISLPAPPAPEPASTDTAELAEPAPAPESDPEDSVPSWADPEHPEIDYSGRPFSSWASNTDEFAGWWSIKESRSEIDDSPETVAYNLSATGTTLFGPERLLVARCFEHQMAIVYVTDEYIAGDFRSDTLPVIVRIDSHPATNERWSKLTSDKGAGVFGRGALHWLRQLAAASEKMFVRITGHRGNQIDATFQLTGAAQALEAVANTCGETTAELDPTAYKTVQQLLNAGDHYHGPIDGNWGSRSKAAMKAFQEASGLNMNGAPDEASLAALGLETGQ